MLALVQAIIVVSYTLLEPIVIHGGFMILYPYCHI
jgi:hypothetical protein